MTSPTAPIGRLTRVTLVGPTRRVDVVLSSDEAVGVLLPDAATMVGYQVSGRPHGFQLSTIDGSVLDPAVGLRAAGIVDGALLRVDPLTEAPPAAVVYDVPDAVADDLSRRPGRWGDAARTRTVTAVCVASGVFATWSAGAQLPAWLLLLGGLVVISGGFVLAVPSGGLVGVALMLTGAASVVVLVPALTTSWLMRCALVALVIGGLMVLLGFVRGRGREGVLGGGTVFALLVLWSTLFAVGLSPEGTAVVMAAVTVGMLGLLPRIALVFSGLTGLDDRHTAEETVSRGSAEAAVDTAHRGLALACTAVAVSAAVAGVILAQVGGAWAMVLAGLLVVAMLLRLRFFPLTVEVVALAAAALTVLGGLVVRWVSEQPGSWWGGVAVATLVIVSCLMVIGYRPTPHARARARQVADRVEAIAVIAIVPVAIGEFDVYSRLLATF
ncbi:hypothetical protein ADK67_44100 [Saccharothrix sp. NRRL B-16348]|uniref:EsaB/YukD family protein n=1 Tax=Saccharothrix sp. NRRL B-16348 TaxID=1415542 RepID=UPI0006AF3F91|nr:EsaB/YukD family protein [Saccharothrix sp. NRRL B-16348]KOX13540.1 hypothetical protein ADK67_44100 [Saccharothrix sp. NRRL B-16348]